VLQGIKTEIGEAGRIRVAVDAEDTAVFPGFVVLKDDLVYRFPFSVFHFHIKPLPERLKGLVAAGFSLRFFPMFVWTGGAGMRSPWRMTRFSVFCIFRVIL